MTTKPIDYRDLLRRYIRHVGECEGITFMPPRHESEIVFTADEIAELRRLDDER